MAVLSRRRIESRLKLTATDPKGLLVTPFVQRKQAFDSDSIDLRLGYYFLVPRLPPEAFYFPAKQTHTSHTRVHVPLGDYLVVPAHQTVLGATLEFIKLPFDTSGQILTKSSVARTFVVVETAPWIHPCYRGCLTLEIANVSNTPLLLYPGRWIGQLILFHVEESQMPTKLGGTYLSPVYPEAPEFNDPEDDLAVLGVERVWVPGSRTSIPTKKPN